jgi:membrane protein implicated in regulation of membrane protease activity
MIQRDPFPFKMIGLWSILILCSLATVYLILIALVCVWVGLNHFPQDGFWVPILAGTIPTFFILWLFVRISRVMLNKIKEKDDLAL